MQGEEGGLFGGNQRDGGHAIVRIKPIGAGGGGVERSAGSLSDGEGSIKYGDGQIEVQTASSRKKYSYPRHVISPEVKNEGVFAKFLPHRIEAFFQGINVNLMCYGQTGSGKTHTIFGTPGIMERAGRGEFGMSAAEDYGIFPRALLEIFGRMKGEPVGECQLTCSVIELDMIQGNKCLFDVGRARMEQQGFASAESFGVTIDRSKKPPTMYGMEEVLLENEEDILRTFAAISTRNTAGTGMNDSSSRTHCFATLKLFRRIGDGSGKQVQISRFQFVDLAGSERLKEASGTSDYRDSSQAFGGMITNYSLTMLGQACNALVQQRRKEEA